MCCLSNASQLNCGYKRSETDKAITTKTHTEPAFTFISPPQLPGFIDQTPGLGLPRGSLRLGPGVAKHAISKP